MTAVLNAANERANELFRGEKLGYLGKQSDISRNHLPQNLTYKVDIRVGVGIGLRILLKLFFDGLQAMFAFYMFVLIIFYSSLGGLIF